MGAVVYVPFVASAVVAVLSRVASSRLWPRAAVSAIAAAAITLSVSSVGALVLLACPLPAQVPLIATLGRWRPAAVATHTPTPAWISMIALVLLATITWRAFNEARELAVELRDADRVRHAIRARSHGDVVVVDDVTPAAHAISGVTARRGVVVISSSMLDLLDADEQAAVIAHERAHLRQHHAVFTAATRLAAAVDPLLTGMVTDMRFALERWADEDAATTTPRLVLAAALARVALELLGNASGQPGMPAPAFHRHGVADRVAALLEEPNRRTRPALALVAFSLAGALALALATHNTERFFEAARVWSRR